MYVKVLNSILAFEAAILDQLNVRVAVRGNIEQEIPSYLGTIDTAQAAAISPLTTVAQFRTHVQRRLTSVLPIVPHVSIIVGNGSEAPDSMNLRALRSTYHLQKNNEMVVLRDYLANMTEVLKGYAGVPKLVKDESVRCRGGFRVELVASMENPPRSGSFTHYGDIWFPELNDKPYAFSWDEYGNCTAASGAYTQKELQLYNLSEEEAPV